MKKLFVIISLILVFMTNTFAEITTHAIMGEDKYLIWTALNAKGLKYEFEGIKYIDPKILTPEITSVLIAGREYDLQYAITDSEEKTLNFLKFNDGKFILEVYKIY